MDRRELLTLASLVVAWFGLATDQVFGQQKYSSSGLGRWSHSRAWMRRARRSRIWKALILRAC